MIILCTAMIVASDLAAVAPVLACGLIKVLCLLLLFMYVCIIACVLMRMCGGRGIGL